MRRLLPFLFASVLSCSQQDQASISLVTGEETDTFTRAPVPTTLRVDAVQGSADGGVLISTLAMASLPTTSLDLGDENEGTAAELTVAGFDSAGTQVLQGTSLLLDFSSLAGATVPIFVQRTGQFARLPGPLADSRPTPTLAIVQGQYLFVGGGTDPSVAFTTELYDFMQLAAVGSPPTLPRAPESIAFGGTVGWLMDAQGGTYFDLSDSSSGDIQLPAGGGSFADIAGGATVFDDNGAQYVVGATRTTGSSSWILKIDPNDTSNASYPYGNATWLELGSPRTGAAAAWVIGQGLVVAGGSATAPGAEIFFEGSSSTESHALPFAPDGSVGSGAAALDGQRVLLAGGIVSGMDAGVRIIDLGCTPPAAAPADGCVPTVWPGLPTLLASAQVFASGGGNAMVVGSEPPLAGDGGSTADAGVTHVYGLTSAGPSEIATKVRHTNARAIASPLGTLVLFGGAGEIESFTGADLPPLAP